MSEVIPFEMALDEIAKLENEIRKGGVIVIPVEGSYVYLADAFNIGAVKRIHELRGDEPGVALGVAIGKVETLSGISASNSDEFKKLANKFWPGLLTLYVQPNASLHWDLGDGNSLGEFAVRIPDSTILITLANNIGPLAMASAALANKGAAKNLDQVSALLSEINFYVDAGGLAESELSTIVRAKVIGAPELEVVRIGAISLKQLQDAIPSISLA